MSEHHDLKKSLGKFQVWGLAVGLVISGEYFGWNYGWGVSGTFGFLISTIVIGFFFGLFVLCLTELSTMLPDAGGPYAYAKRALGKHFGHLTAVLTLIEFVFAPPAIAFAIGGYLHVLIPSVDANTLAMITLIFFGALNFFSMQASAKFEMVVTFLAVIELCVFIAVMIPHFHWSNFAHNGWDHGVKGIFASMPFAVWLFLGIEGVAMASEEVENPGKNLPFGYITGIITLVILAIAVMLAAGGAVDWKTLSDIDYPIPKAIALVTGQDHILGKAFAGLGLFGLMASLNGIIIGASRQIFALSRAQVLPYKLSVTNRYASPHYCVLITVVIGAISILSGKTGELITLSGIGAVAMYICCIISFFILRIKEPKLHRAFSVPCYPVIPLITLFLSVVAFLAMAYFNHIIFGIFILIIVLALAAMSFLQK